MGVEILKYRGIFGGFGIWAGFEQIYDRKFGGLNLNFEFLKLNKFEK